MSDNPLGEALAAHQAGRLAEAETLYRTVIAADPDSANAWYLLGVVLHQTGRIDDSLGAYDAAIRLAPEAAEILFKRAVALSAIGRAAEAEADLRRAVGLRPDFVEGQTMLGGLLLDRGDNADAARAFAAALARQPANRAAALNRGIALQRAGQIDDAIAAFRHAIAVAPESADAHRCLAALLVERRDPDATEAAERAVALAPEDSAAWFVRGAAALAAEDLADAVRAFERTLALDPDHAEALTRLAHTRANLCDWSDGGASARRLAEVAGRVPIWPWAVAVLPSTAAEQRRAAEVWAAAKTTTGSPRPAMRRRKPGERLRIGYLSADFHEHATARLAVEVFERHDRARVETVAYSTGPDDRSALRRRLTGAFERFVDLRETPDDREASARIAADGIDILVDLKGWTQEARPEILARRPAPVQIAWLGYPGAMGADWIDYVIADPVVLPSALEPHFGEAVIRLPECYQPNDARRAVAPTTPERAAHGLPETGFVFCCFNNVYKIQPAIFDVWMRLLRDVPQSALWLLSPHDHPIPALRREAAARGVDPARLVFAPALPQAEHLARLTRADLFLDTLPVNAHTTASDALWAGLPLVTCKGETFAGRVAASLVSAMALPELAVETLEDYRALALALARDPARLANLRARLVANRRTAPLFDAARFARHLEIAFETAVARAAAGLPPARFDVESI